MTRMTGAEALAKSLASEGVEVVFGLPGVQIMDIYDALFDTPQIRLVTVRSEFAATYMAYGYSRTTGKIGVALVVPGPGALNATSGLATAYAASTPVLLISGQVESYNVGKGRGAVHEIHDQLDVFRPVTKSCRRIESVEQIPEAVHEAMRLLRTGRPRPVELEIPWDLLSTTADLELMDPASYRRKESDPAKLREAVRLLQQADRPLIWVGGGVITSDASSQLTALAEALGAAVITTQNGKGAITEDHPLSLGVYYYSHGPAYKALPQADVILAVGTRLYLSPRAPWGFQRHQRRIHVDIDPEEVGRNWPVRVGIVADAKAALSAILSQLGTSHSSSGWPTGDLESIRRETRQWVRREAGTQVEIIQALRRELDDDAILVSGITNIGYWCHLSYPVLKPRSYVTTSYQATLGFAFPTAMGASLGNSQRQVVAVCGDGGFMYAVGELATAVQEEANLVALVFNDNAFGASLNDQQTRFQGRVIGTKLHNPDFAALAESFGARGVKLESHRQLGEALRTALRHRGPVVIEVPIPTLVPPFQVPPLGVE